MKKEHSDWGNDIDIIPIYYYCLNCWGNSYFDFQYIDLKGKTLVQIREMVQYRHQSYNPCVNPDVRLCPIVKKPKH